MVRIDHMKKVIGICILLSAGLSVSAQSNSEDCESVLKNAYDQGAGARLYWVSPPLSYGRVFQARSEAGFKHELNHTLIDGNLGGDNWDQDFHHELMKRCNL